MSPTSILKKPSAPNLPSTDKAVNPRHLEVALHHANIIENQKNVEKEILKAILDLMDFPTDPKADPARPSPADAAAFCNPLNLFQPSDYDSLIEERNLAEHCGYALCPRPRKKARNNARRHLITTENGVQVVEKKALEVWCSDDCARRAMYVKVQLNEEPAWLRRGGVGQKIELMAENQGEHQIALPLRLKGTNAPATEQMSEEDAAWAMRDEALAELAQERGEKPGQLSKANDVLIAAEIKENTDSKTPIAPSAEGMGHSHFAIEGHVPKADLKKEHDSSEEEYEAEDGDEDQEGEDADDDWDIAEMVEDELDAVLQDT
ncbi:hypothetical protein GQ43DRAFT_444536 [Delitschia confertaspora ATCC 74209]|uniref:RNA polymerase II subunit B1 CTD phosphatase RPAP2 homolog n=1 Tax=Delitschia confertaspora ATCC 74209 TaxID=1513339 RepID=A0A9P4MLH9_9PLEO|nr:hypothetical protein GQ43DRAFT_444536 [Delitschia confertaspora ATCC 74209]